ncbi:MAG: aspartate/glutamate racemase family protein [Candidatus Aminicenantes bacterium]|nr:aspartate/glutamate racemase family protein [Candidatus Aminicenantes bacterium]
MLRCGRRRKAIRAEAWASAGLLLFLCGLSRAGAARMEADWPNLFTRDKVTIAVTDSGLGGLSVMAEAAARLRAARSFRSVDLVFWNSLFSNDSGYNSLETRRQRILVFDSSLRRLAAEVKPDLILVACNTLSVLLDDVPFVRETNIPIAGIIEAGAAQMAEALKAEPRAVGLLFGTKTTIAEGVHLQKLIASGIDASRLTPQPCPNLVGRIEEDWRGKETERLISSFVAEAAERLADPTAPVYAALFCTHFGYAAELWERAFASRGLRLAGLVNPNSRWIDFLDPPERKNRFRRSRLRTRVISMVEIPAGVRTSLGEWLEKISPETAAALRKYRLAPGLFEWASLLK